MVRMDFLLVSGFVLELDGGIVALDDGIAAGEAAPRFEPDFVLELAVVERRGLDFHGLGMRAGRLPVEFHVGLEVEDAAGWVVKSAGGGASPFSKAKVDGRSVCA